MIDKLDQLRDFAAWEHEYDPAPDGKMHIAAWAIAEIEQLRAKLEWMPSGPDGIDCRNETIKLQDENVKRLRAEIDDLRARVAMLEAEADENAGSAITAMPIQIGDDLCYLPVNAHGIVKMALMECSAEPVYIPPMIDVSADIHPDEIAGFERGAQSALNYVFNMGPLYTAAKVPHK